MGKGLVRCRVCWVKERKQKMLPVTGPCGEGPQSISDAILLCVPTSTIKEDDWICGICSEQLTPAFQFVSLCLETEKLLKQEKSKPGSLPNLIQISVTTDDNDDNEEHSQPELDEEIHANANVPEEAPPKRDELLDFGLDDLQYISVPIQPSEDFKDKLTEIGVNVVDLSSDPSKKKRVIFLTRDLDVLYEKGPEHLVNAYRERQIDSSKTVFPCRVCPATFEDASDFRQHCTILHNNPRPFLCRRCGKCFKNYMFLYKHETMYKGLESCHFKCARCKKTFGSKGMLQRHLEEVANAPSCRFLKCKVCSVKFETKDFKEHCKEHANFLCVKCGKCVTSALRLAQHENKAHSKEAGTGAHAKDAGTRAQDSMCEKCGKIFQSTHALRSHIRGTHSGQVFICDKCAQQFRSQKCLTSHYNLKHSTKGSRIFGSSAGVPRAYFCDKCNKVCLTKSGFLYHMRFIHPFSNTTPEDAKMYGCSACSASCRSEADLQKHRLICVGTASPNQPPAALNTNTSCVCRICHKVVGRLYNLKLHYKGHLGLRQNECHICGRRIQSALSLRRHLLKHVQTNDTYSCKFCQVTYPSFVDLEEHMEKMHIKKRYKCKYCPQKFGLRMLWLSHESIEHEDVNAKKEKVLKMLMSRPIFLKDRQYRNLLPKGSSKNLRMDVDELLEKLNTAGENIDDYEPLEADFQESSPQKDNESFTEQQYACEVLESFNLME